MGLAISLVLIYVDKTNIAWGQDNSEEKYGLQDFRNDLDIFEKDSDWKTLMNNTSIGKDIYLAIGNKLFVTPEKEALTAITQKYGLTTDEAELIVGGSAIPLLNKNVDSPNRINQDKAIEAVKKMQDDFADFKEVYDMQQKIDIEVSPSELFSNGDLADSGFDLLYDLELIEKILFQETSDVTMGGSFPGAMDSPFPDAKIRTADLPEGFGGGGQDKNTFLRTDKRTAKAKMNIGDETIEGDILEDDICPSEDDLSAANENYDQEHPQEDEVPEKPAEEAEEAQDQIEGVNAPDEDGIVTAQPIIPDNTFCPALNSNAGEVGASATAMASLSDGLPSTGAAASASFGGIRADVGICIDVEMVWKKLTSYTPGDSCIQCEVELIEDEMNKTLSHSFMPNKTTGNIFESAKCSKSLNLSKLIDMQVILMGSPVPSPPHDEILFGDSAVEEWNKFVNRLGWDEETEDGESSPASKIGSDPAEEFILSVVLPDTTQSQIVAAINQTKTKNLAEAQANVAAYETEVVGEGLSEHQKIIIEQLKEMTASFKTFDQKWKTIATKICPKILSKSSPD